MGLGGISIWQLVIILVIVLLIFGTKRLKGLGGDLGGAIKGFKEAVSSNGEKEEDEDLEQSDSDAAQASQSTEHTDEQTSSDKSV